MTPFRSYTKAAPLIMVLLLALVVLLPAGAMCAGNSDDHFATFASDSIGPFLAAGELALFAGGKTGKLEAVQGAKALAATGLATELLKCTVREKRPLSDSPTSFPSGHTSAAFAMATVLGDYHPQYRWPAYLAAGAIGWSRVEVREHRWRDVAAGALLGTFIAKKFTNKHFYAGADGIGFQTKW